MHEAQLRRRLLIDHQIFRRWKGESWQLHKSRLPSHLAQPPNFTNLILALVNIILRVYWILLSPNLIHLPWKIILISSKPSARIMQVHATGSEPSPVNTRGLCLLSLDGGGVRGLSTLLILKSVMDRLNDERHKSALSPVKPCKVFDLISGTSKGGYVQ